VEVCDAVAFPEIVPVPFTAEIVGKCEFVPWSTVCDGDGAWSVEFATFPAPILVAPFCIVPIKLIRLDGGRVIVVETEM
jgi:hypothetical protein